MANNLVTNILINAEVGSGLYQVGSTLTELGSIVDGLSQRIIDFGEESIEVFRNYQTNMRDAEVALSTTYGQGSQELQRIMSQLDESATEWAATTIFHTNDVASAISEAAHAGWDYQQIMAGIPAAMRLAQAGGLDLSDAVNYVVKSTNAAGIGFEDMDHWIDLWTFAANSSASTIGEFGDAMLRMGSTMRFASDPEELMTLIAVTADAGSVGSEAGTMVRNSIMRLIAPTQKAQEAMELLGATSDEVSEVMNDEALAAANAELASCGFTVFDQNTGEMRPILDIYNDLSDCLADIAGGYDNISSNEDALSILSAIFPTRTITEALNLLNATRESYGGLYDAMKAGEAEGYGEYAAETMMDSLGGDIEIFESKVERLKQVVGESLSDDVSGLLDVLGGVVDGLAEMDDGKLDMLVGAGEVLAAAGPGLVLAGGAFRLIGLMATPAGAVAGSLLAAAGALGAMYQYSQNDFADKFGDLALDTEEISSYIQNIAGDFESAYADVDKFNTALETAVEDYSNASATFSSTLITSSLTGLEQDDIDKLEDLGGQMYSALMAGIENNYASDMLTITNAFGGLENVDGDTTWAHIIEVMELGHQSAVEQAKKLSQELRDAMTNAFADGKLTGEEVSDIMSIMEQENELMAMQTDAENYAAQQEELRKVQTLGLDGLQEISEMEAQRQSDVMEALYKQQDNAYGNLAAQLDYAVEHGTVLEDGTVVTREYADQMLSELRAKQQYEAAGYHTQFLPFSMGLFNQVGQSELADVWGGIGAFADSYLAAGTVTESDFNAYQAYDDGDRSQVATLMTWYMNTLGGVEQVSKDINALLSTEGKTAEQVANDVQLANELMRVQAMYDLSVAPTYGGYLDNGYSAAYAAASGYSVEDARAQAETINETTGGMLDIVMNALNGALAYGDTSEFNNLMSANYTDTGFQSGFTDIVEQLQQTYDLAAVEVPQALEGIHDYVASYLLMYGGLDAEHYRIPVEPDMTALDEGLGTLAVPIELYVEGTDAMASLQEQGVDVSVGADMTEITADIDGADGQTLLEYVDGDATDLEMSITDQDGRVLEENVTGNAAELERIISSYSGRVVTVNIRGRQLFAEGGRATSPSTFGDAGPEWAIPEEHSERTAALLNAARAASGFTWPDLLARFGGMNANAGYTPTTVVYSPVIHAENAAGVEAVLQADHARFEKWWNEKQMREAVEVFQ